MNIIILNRILLVGYHLLVIILLTPTIILAETNIFWNVPNSKVAWNEGWASQPGFLKNEKIPVEIVKQCKEQCKLYQWNDTALKEIGFIKIKNRPKTVLMELYPEGHPNRGANSFYDCNCSGTESVCEEIPFKVDKKKELLIQGNEHESMFAMLDNKPTVEYVNGKEALSLWLLFKYSYKRSLERGNGRIRSLQAHFYVDCSNKTLWEDRWIPYYANGKALETGYDSNTSKRGWYSPNDSFHVNIVALACKNKELISGNNDDKLTQASPKHTALPKKIFGKLIGLRFHRGEGAFLDFLTDDGQSMAMILSETLTDRSDVGQYNDPKNEGKRIEIEYVLDKNSQDSLDESTIANIRFIDK